MEHIEVVGVAMCLTLLAGWLCWTSFASARMPHYFSLVANGTHLCIFKMLRMKRGIQKYPQTPKKLIPPLDRPGQCTGLGFQN